MKKLFALVMVCAMALALAAPTLAATGWDKPQTTPPNYGDFAMTAEKYEWYSATVGRYGANGIYFPVWNDSRGVVQDTLGRVYFTATLPTAADAAALYPGVSFQNLTINIKITNVKAVREVDLETSPVVYDPMLGTSGVDNKNVFTDSKSAALGASAQTLKYMFVFRAASAGDIVASINISAGATALPTTFLYKGYQVTAGADVSTLGDWAFSYSGGAIVFDTDGADKIQRVFLYNGANYYQVFLDLNNNIAFKDGLASTQYGDPGYAALKTLFDFFMGALGFAWDGSTKYMNAKLIIDNLIKSASGTVSTVLPGGYQSIVQPGPVQPPQTGDASTVIGFAMIALAFIAAAAATVRKVRA